ncbi:MAG: HAD-IA family hydrolase, partial [Gemmatimonadetes bacterium]|nr:HAD family phosphatase [Gemmatimonadota bacterium]NIQ55111.1 HAD family phosphatase [Gemmatimonadota bacterium]NIU75307.1 HAD-IA family hydrolase [Gammaproteobacteria bacterium]NIX45093.1 HAD-IA family hydrolase [Gemmatimonadota bacterium]NIY09346.1 HAD-IA family hydrolase [Gemmatimonadota bacterium]
GVAADELERRARAAFLDELATGLEAYEDARLLLESVLAEGRPVGVGSNSARWRLDAVLTAAGVRDRFRASVAGDEVANPKPAPDVYARVVASLGVAPAACVVIEDSPTGIAAAAAA